MKLWADRRSTPTTTEERSSWMVPLSPWEGAAPGWAGVSVTQENAMRSAAVAGCVRVLTTTAATLPVDVIREQGARRITVTPTPLVVRDPSGIVRRRGWVAQVVKGMLLNGNAYGLVTAFDFRGIPTQVETLSRRDVTWVKDQGEHRIKVNGKVEKLWPAGPVVHIPASAFLNPGSPVADSPAELAKEAIGTALAAERFGAQFFGDGGHPHVVAKAKKDLTQDQARTIKDRIKAAWIGREAAVVGAGIDLEFPKENVTDSGFVDLLRFEVEQACRFFGVPPSMVYAAISGQSITYANITDDDLRYLKHSAGIWLNDVEDAWSELLPAGQLVRFNVDAFLRMDAKGRHALYGTRLANRTITINEIRALEDEEPFDGDEFDEPGIPGGAAPTSSTDDDTDPDDTDPAAPPEED